MCDRATRGGGTEATPYALLQNHTPAPQNSEPPTPSIHLVPGAGGCTQTRLENIDTYLSHSSIGYRRLDRNLFMLKWFMVLRLNKFCNGSSSTRSFLFLSLFGRPASTQNPRADIGKGGSGYFGPPQALTRNGHGKNPRGTWQEGHDNSPDKYRTIKAETSFLVALSLPYNSASPSAKKNCRALRLAGSVLGRFCSGVSWSPAVSPAQKRKDKQQTLAPGEEAKNT